MIPTGTSGRRKVLFPLKARSLQEVCHLPLSFNLKLSPASPLPFASEKPEFYRELRWFFRTLVHHLLGFLALQIKSLFLVPTSHLSVYWSVVQQAV